MTTTVALSSTQMPVRQLRRLAMAWPFLLAGLAAGLYGAAFVRAYTSFGLFRGLGTDWTFYWAQARELRLGDSGHLYDLTALSSQVQLLAAFSRYPDQPMPIGPVPYFPLFAWLFQPLTILDPRLAFGLWTGLTLLTALYLAWRAASLFPDGQRWRVALLVFTSAPVIQTLYIGQPALLIGAAVGECCLALVAGRNLLGGLWLACAFFKPQYGVLLGPLLVWQGRWVSVLGASIGVAALLVAAIGLAGGPALLSFPPALAYDAGFRGGPFTYAELQINWRSLVLAIFPNITDNRGLALTAVLSLATVAATAAFAWRGGWDARDPRLAARICAVVVATLLVSYQSHIHGLALLILPLAAVLARARPGSLIPALAMALLVEPVVSIIVNSVSPQWSLPPDPVFGLLLAGLLAALLWECAAQDVRHHAKLGPI